MKNEYEIGDLVRLSVRGRISLCKDINDGSIGIVTATSKTKKFEGHNALVEVRWCETQETSRMHIDYIELLDNRTKTVRSDT